MDQMEREYAREVGKRLRSVRKQQRYSLQAVESMSNKEFKASVLGAYERGERSISVPRLQRLAEFYSVGVDQLLPQDQTLREVINLTTRSRAVSSLSPDVVRVDLVELERRQELPSTKSRCAHEVRCAIDLTRLSNLIGSERDLLQRYLNMIQISRQDFNGRVMTVRADDLRIIGAVLGLTFEEMIGLLDELGLRIPS
ncbi:MAG: helix-turn-helix domain-containing protein [Ferrimicrobium sp.]